MREKPHAWSQTIEESGTSVLRPLAALAALAIAALALYAYRDLPARPFAADDYQWLVAVQGLSFGEVARQAFDAGAQSHFYRPLVWLLFWAQGRAFGLDPRGYHVVSLALHLLNAGLMGLLAFRLQIRAQSGQSTICNLQPAIPLLAAGIFALHPAPFEAVVWVSAQSELLAAALLLAALHLWLPRPATSDQRPTTNDQALKPEEPKPQAPRPKPHAWPLLATLALGLALLAKESAVIGLPLLFLVDRWNVGTFQRSSVQRFVPYLLPALVTLAYVALQVMVERRNYLLAQGGYGLGSQIILNPLRSLALIAAPLPGTEHADAAWLVPVGAVVALIVIFWMLDFGSWRDAGPKFKTQNSKFKISAALGLTLLPTAPFTSPPDSRYLYLPVMAAALLIARTMDDGRWTIGRSIEASHRLSSIVYRLSVVVGTLLIGLLLAWWAAGELHAREGRFAAAAGPGGSLWRLATSVCAEGRPDRMVIVEPPLAPPHAEAIVSLACGPKVKTKIVGRDQVDGAIKGRSIVVDFPGGSAQVVRRS